MLLCGPDNGGDSLVLHWLLVSGRTDEPELGQLAIFLSHLVAS